MLKMRVLVFVEEHPDIFSGHRVTLLKWFSISSFCLYPGASFSFICVHRK